MKFLTNRILIENWLEKMNIADYEIDPYGVVNVKGSVDLSKKGLEILPVKFGETVGFNCSYNNLSSLAGSPDKVRGAFLCQGNQLQSLDKGPGEVWGRYDCSYNKLTDLKGLPEQLRRGFTCTHNLLTTLEGAPKYMKGAFNCGENPLKRLDYLPEVFRGSYLVNCFNNLIETLEGITANVAVMHVVHLNKLDEKMISGLEQYYKPHEHIPSAKMLWLDKNELRYIYLNQKLSENKEKTEPPKLKI